MTMDLGAFIENQSFSVPVVMGYLGLVAQRPEAVDAFNNLLRQARLGVTLTPESQGAAGQSEQRNPPPDDRS